MYIGICIDEVNILKFYHVRYFNLFTIYVLRVFMYVFRNRNPLETRWR